MKDIIYLSQADFTTLANGGTITKGGQTYSYDDGNVYMVSNEWTKVWENSSPTAQMGATTLSIDLSGYREIKIAVSPFASNNFAQFSQVFDIGEVSHLHCSTPGGSSARKVQVTSDSVVFSRGFYLNSSWTKQENDAYLIPLEIYAR